LKNYPLHVRTSSNPEPNPLYVIALRLAAPGQGPKAYLVEQQQQQQQQQQQRQFVGKA
jgi:hypothetical protein